MKILFLLKILLIIFLFIIYPQLSMGYSPEITGKLEKGDKSYTETSEEMEEEILDTYNYDQIWLRYKQKLAPYEYYYFKAQYYQKNYLEKNNYNNITLDLWSNFTYYPGSNLRNRWNFDFKDKNYYLKEDNSYQAYKLKYQIDYEYNALHKYTVYLQRQWNNYKINTVKDNTQDRFSVNWNYKISSDFEVKTNLSLDRQKFDDYFTDSTNKYGRKVSLNFKYSP